MNCNNEHRPINSFQETSLKNLLKDCRLLLIKCGFSRYPRGRKTASPKRRPDSIFSMPFKAQFDHKKKFVADLKLSGKHVYQEIVLLLRGLGTSSISFDWPDAIALTHKAIQAVDHLRWFSVTCCSAHPPHLRRYRLPAELILTKHRGKAELIVTC